MIEQAYKLHPSWYTLSLAEREVILARTKEHVAELKEFGESEVAVDWEIRVAAMEAAMGAV